MTADEAEEDLPRLSERSDPLRKLIGARAPEQLDELLKGSSEPEPPEEEGPGGLRGLLRMLGPGLVAGAADDDPSNIGVYAQVGSQFGYGVLWLFMLTLPLMAAVQEVSARIALHTGSGLAASLRRRFPAWLVAVMVAGLVLGNAITLGADLSAVAAGIALLLRDRVPAIWFVIPVALFLLGLQLKLTYRQIEGVFKFLTVVLFAYVLQALLLRPDPVPVLVATVVPHVDLSPAYVTGMVAVLGTTLSPYIFFWQASILVDEKRNQGGLTLARREGVQGRRLWRKRADVMIGIVVAQLVMYGLVISTALTLHAHGKTDVQSAAQAAESLTPIAGPFAFVIFAAGLIASGLLTIPVLSASSAYAFGECFDLPGTLGTRPRYRPAFYGIIVAATLFGIVFNFLRLNPIRALVVSSVIEGLIAAPLLVMIVLLGSDRRVMGEWRSGLLSRLLVWFAALVMTASSLYFIGSLVTGKGA